MKKLCAQLDIPLENTVAVGDGANDLPMLSAAGVAVVYNAISAKKYLEQIRIAKDVVHSRNQNDEIKHLVKGLMIESYIEDGNQPPTGSTYGQSITDPCLGWEKTERLIYDIADVL